MVSRGGPRLPTTGAATRAAAQPRRARGPAHGPAAGPARHEPGRDVPVAELAAATPADSVPLDPGRGRGRDHARGRDEIVKGSALSRGGAVGPAPAHLARRVLSDQHRDGRAPLRRGGRAGRPDRPRAGARPLLRDRHHRARRWRSTRARSGASRWWRRRWPTPSRTPASTASTTPGSSPATCALAMRPLLEQSGKPDVVVVDPPRAGLSQKIVRRVLEAEARRIVYVSCNPTTLAPNARQMVDAGYELQDGPPGGHVPADPAHRVRGPAGAFLAGRAASSSTQPARSHARCTGTGPRSRARP